MSEETPKNKSQAVDPATTTRKEGSGVFKSQDIAPQKMSKFANSAVSDKAVQRDEGAAAAVGRYIGPEQQVQEGGVYVGPSQEPGAGGVYVGPEQAAADGGMYIGPSAEPGTNSVHIGAEPESPKEDPVEAQMEELRESMAQVEEMRQSIEQRQAEVDQKMQAAEAMLAKVAKINESLTVDDRLRKRIEATIARTRGLRRSVKN
jgi:hypothetical protein